MKNRLERLYKEGKITQEQLHEAVVKGWITEEEYFDIVGEQNVSDSETQAD